MLKLVPDMRFELGTCVHCTDGEFGELVDLVINPRTKHLTHLVVRPRQASDLTRLIPADIVVAAGDEEISLSCSIEATHKFAVPQGFAYLGVGDRPVMDPQWDVGVEDAVPPYYPNGDMGGYTAYDEPLGVSYDRVPKGEVEIRRDSRVSSADGEDVGHVNGFLVDSDDQITHLVLERGHLWRRRDIAIAISSVSSVETDRVTVALTTAQLKELPHMHVHGWNSPKDGDS